MLNHTAVSILKKYFVFDEIFDLLEYDFNMNELYNKLKELRKDCYDLNYRFIFLHYDTEFYTSPDYIGLTIINLQKILESLDIPNYFCLILSQQDLQPACNRAKEYFAPNDDCSITVIKNFLHTPIQPIVTDVELNEKNIQKHYVSFNNVGRFHRRILMALLRDNNLLNLGLVSYLGKQ